MQATAKKLVLNLETIKTAMAAKMDSAAFNTWISPLKLDVTADVLTLTAPNQFSADFIKSVYLNVLQSVAVDFNLALAIHVHGVAVAATATANDNNAQTFIPAAITAAPVSVTGFDNFIASDENAFVLSACKKLASGSASFSPLFIYGASGCGKSLLVDCIHAAAAGRTLMMTGGQFISEFVRAMRDHSVFAFKDFCRNCDTFILDDVQTLSGKRATMDEFLQLIMDLRASGKNIVLTANAAPSNLGGFDRRVQSLFASGLVADIAAPTKNVKKIILQRGGVSVDVADMLSSRVGADGHLIAGVVMKIKTYTELMGEKVTVAVAERLLADALAKNKTPLSMVKSMCEKMGVSYDEICAAGRSRTIVRARQIMMTALKAATTLSLAEIGRLVGDRDHATVLYAIAQTQKLKSSDLMVSAEIDQMIAECK